MTQESFIDYYGILQLSTSAELETIERVFRMLAKRYHPDNRLAGNAEKFNMLIRAYEVLSHPEQRAAYDLTYEKERALQWKVFEEALPS